MNEQSRPRRLPMSVMQVADESDADIAAGRVESFDLFLARLDQRIETRAAELEQKEHGPTKD